MNTTVTHQIDFEQIKKAEAVALRLLEADADNIAAWEVLAAAAIAQNQLNDARVALESILRVDDRNVKALQGLVRLLIHNGQVEQAREVAWRSVEIDPMSMDSWQLFVGALGPNVDPNLNIIGQAIQKLLNVISNASPSKEHFIVLHQLWLSKCNIEQAADAALMAIGCAPDDVDLKLAFGKFLFRYGKTTFATKIFAEVAEEHPENSSAWLGFAACNHELVNIDLAMEGYQKTIELEPDSVGAHKNLGTLHALRRDWPAAIAEMEAVLALDPKNISARLQRFNYQRWCCDWSTEDLGAIKEALENYDGFDASPFQALVLADSPDLQLKLGKQWSNEKPLQRTTVFDRSSGRNGKIRVGWFGNDFHDHATMFLLAGVLREYDRSKFEFFIYSYGPDKPSVYRNLAKEASTEFYNFARANDEVISRQAIADELDIAIDLKGYTNGAKPNIFRRGVAPIQISYLGYPGTMGKPAYDYVIADKVVIPPEFRDHFSEAVLYMPDSYQPNDSEREIAAMPSRVDFGLPEGSLVFACFNQAYKYGPEEFAVWMKLLSDVEGSVLWLYVGNNDAAKSNLINEAKKFGVTESRLYFASQLPSHEHLARCRLVDVFLDCWLVNAHTTASDALWAGVPIVTLTGKQFAARVATSLLLAVDKPELVAETEQEYYEIALSLALDESLRSRIRAELQASKESSALFDSVKYTRALESLLAEVHRRCQLDLPPADISL